MGPSRKSIASTAYARAVALTLVAYTFMNVWYPPFLPISLIILCRCLSPKVIFAMVVVMDVSTAVLSVFRSTFNSSSIEFVGGCGATVSEAIMASCASRSDDIEQTSPVITAFLSLGKVLSAAMAWGMTPIDTIMAIVSARCFGRLRILSHNHSAALTGEITNFANVDCGQGPRRCCTSSVRSGLLYSTHSSSVKPGGGLGNGFGPSSSSLFLDFFFFFAIAVDLIHHSEGNKCPRGQDPFSWAGPLLARLSMWCTIGAPHLCWEFLQLSNITS
mmetsp:Transcript_16869/g.36699  ORF Transcript_16869/g.36699 Transcript_16869/m.36699 type:complete len:274 (+) Transcript_16869:436-1257(+)